MKEKIEKLLDELANLCLESGENYYDYSDAALVDASVIFMNIFTAKMWEYQKIEKKLSIEQLKMLAQESGNSLRQTILLFTGRDMHQTTKTAYKK